MEKFAKKIEQLAIIKELGLLVVLAGMSSSPSHVVDSDSAVFLYDLHSFGLQEQLAKTKGASVFAITSNIEKDSDGVPTIVSRLAISVKRKLIVYSWHDAELLPCEVLRLFAELTKGIPSPRPRKNVDLDVVKEAVSWSFFRLHHLRYLDLDIHRYFLPRYDILFGAKCLGRHGSGNRIPWYSCSSSPLCATPHRPTAPRKRHVICISGRRRKAGGPKTDAMETCS